MLLLLRSPSALTTFTPSSASADGNPVCALSVVDALANVATGSLAYVPGSQWAAKWAPSKFRANWTDQASLTGPVTVVWTFIRLEATEYPLEVADSEGGTSTADAGGARSTFTHTTTVTVPSGGWSKLRQLHDLVVSVAVGGDDAGKIACRTALLRVGALSAVAVGTPVVTIVQPPERVAVGVKPRVQWAFDHPDGYAQDEYVVRVFDGAPSPDADTDPGPLYDSGTVSSAWAEHVISEQLDYASGLRVYVKARASGGTWSTWVYRTVTSEPTVVSSAPTVAAPNGAYSGDPVPTLTISSLSPQFHSSGLAAVQVRGYYGNSAADPDVDEADVDLWGEVTWGPNLHPDSSFDWAATSTTTTVGSGTVAGSTARTRADQAAELVSRIKAYEAGADGLPARVALAREQGLRARSGARSLAVTTGGGTDGAFTYSGVDTPRTSHYAVSAWVWAPAGTAYTWGVRSVETDLTTVIATTTVSATGTGNWQRHYGTVLPGGSGDCRVGFYLTSTATSGTVLYVDDVEVVAGTVPTLTCTEPLPDGTVTYWHCRAVALSGRATGWGTSNTTPGYTGAPTASAATATADTSNHRVAIAVTRASGYTGNARLEAQRSDDAGTTWVDVYGSGTSTWALNSTGASVTVYDRAAPSGTSPQYRYRLVGYASTTQPKPQAWQALSLTGGPLGAQTWLRDPYAPANDQQVSLQVDGFSVTSQVDPDTVRGFGATAGVAAGTGQSQRTIAAALLVETSAEATALATLLGCGRTLLLQAPWGGQWWVRPVGAVRTGSILTASRATAPVDELTVTFVEVDQPEA